MNMHQDDFIVTHFDGVNKRHSDLFAIELMGEVRKIMGSHEAQEKEDFREIKDLIKEKDEASQSRHNELSGRFEEMQKSTSALIFENNRTTSEIHKLFKAAFPNGDPEEHRRDHEQQKEKYKEDREMWLDIKKKAVSSILLAVIFWAGLVLWAAFVKGPIN